MVGQLNTRYNPVDHHPSHSTPGIEPLDRFQAVLMMYMENLEILKYPRGEFISYTLYTVDFLRIRLEVALLLFEIFHLSNLNCFKCVLNYPDY